jgi:L-seryl-tRNA(Ser) seleniumtransferase
MKVHTSNYRVVGFTHAVAADDLVTLGRARGVAVIEDLGSGALVDLTPFGLAGEPVVRARIAAGIDLVTFSGDKLLGGPQAGIIVGRKALVDAIRANPLRRALRPGKLVLAGLAATLRLYRAAPDPAAVFPLLRLAARSLDAIEATTYEAAERLARALGPDYRIGLIESECRIGSGALPEAVLPSRALSVTHLRDGPDVVAGRFRASDPPIIGRIHDGAFLLDMRGIVDADSVVPRAVAD